MAKKKVNKVKTDEALKADEVVTNENENVSGEVKTDEAPKAPKDLKFTKKQFVTSRKFPNRKDLVNALLEEGKTYSIKEVEDIINNFLYGNKK